MISLKSIFIKFFKVMKHLFYDIIPKYYDVKWYKQDFDCKLNYYFEKPIIYLFTLIVSLFDIEITIYRLVFIMGFLKGVLSSVKTSKRNQEVGGCKTLS